MNEMKGLVNEVSDMQEQLQELNDQVLKLVEEGDVDTALGLIDANLEVIAEQLESGYKGMEQIAMLDTLASLRLSMGDFEEAERILGQVCVATDPSPIVVRVNIHQLFTVLLFSPTFVTVSSILSCACLQIKDLMEDVGIDSLQPLADRILQHMGSMYTELGKPEEGLPFYLKSLEIQEDLVGKYSHPSPFCLIKFQDHSSTSCDVSRG